jgi:hypothetical protein
MFSPVRYIFVNHDNILYSHQKELDYRRCMQILDPSGIQIQMAMLRTSVHGEKLSSMRLARVVYAAMMTHMRLSYVLIANYWLI